MPAKRDVCFLSFSTKARWFLVRICMYFFCKSKREFNERKLKHFEYLSSVICVFNFNSFRNVSLHMSTVCIFLCWMYNMNIFLFYMASLLMMSRLAPMDLYPIIMRLFYIYILFRFSFLLRKYALIFATLSVWNFD